MRKSLKLFTVFLIALLLSCAGKEENKEGSFTIKGKSENKSKVVKNENLIASKKIDLKNKGIGPVKSVELVQQIDHSMVELGANVFNQKCTVCHRPDKKFIGPPTAKILERRTPEWVMNMLLNPEEMLKKDPIAKALLVEFYGTPMINQSLTHEEARAILEYHRTLD